MSNEHRKVQHLFYLSTQVDEEVSNSFRVAIKGLSMELCRSPVHLDLRVEELSDQPAMEVRQLLESDDPHTQYTCWMKQHSNEQHSLVFRCPREHPLAIAYRASNSDAKWAAALGKIAAVWTEIDKYLIWHEALHLLGADDCYPPGGGPHTCELHNCIMQFEPTAEHVGQWPWICNTNVARMKGEAS